jgi:hypothetical protein
MQLRQLVLLKQKPDRVVYAFCPIGVIAFPDHLIEPFEKLR